VAVLGHRNRVEGVANRNGVNEVQAPIETHLRHVRLKSLTRDITYQTSECSGIPPVPLKVQPGLHRDHTREEQCNQDTNLQSSDRSAKVE
jgi:hypothetical protein